MASAAERKKIDHELRKLGFGGLDDPNVVQQIAFLIKNHEQFRNQLFSVAPDQRRNAYHSLRPHLRFPAKPLDVYEAEMKELADRMQLPTLREGEVYTTPYRAAEINLDKLATEAIQQNKHEVGGGSLQITCSKCRETGTFRAKLRKDAEKESHQAGWRSDGRKDYCPKCVPTRCTMKLLCINCEKEEQLRCWDPQDGYAKARLAGWVIGDTATCPSCSAKELPLQ